MAPETSAAAVVEQLGRGNESAGIGYPATREAPAIDADAAFTRGSID